MNSLRADLSSVASPLLLDQLFLGRVQAQFKFPWPKQPFGLDTYTKLQWSKEDLDPTWFMDQSIIQYQ